MNKESLANVASAIVSSGRGILAADESTPTMGKRLALIGQENTEENRRDFRQALFDTDGMESFISGVILFEETLEQKSSEGVRLSKILKDKGVYPGIKVDKGAHPMGSSSSEKLTKGLEGLYERCLDYYKLGARFAKWRAVITIGDDIPTDDCIQENASALARYARACQDAELVPIVEPEVLMDGDHTAKDCYVKTSEVIKKCFEELILHKVDLKGIILKPNMILSGNKSKEQISSEDVAKLTLECLINSVPSEVPGIAFLSGGQSEIEATENLNLINKTNSSNFIMSYSFGRALQQSALKFWSKNIQDIQGTQKVFNHRAKMNTLASLGKWSKEIENKQ